MGDYSLARTRSAISLRPRTTLLVTRTKSLSDLTSYIRASPRYKPQWSYHYYRDWDTIYEDVQPRKLKIYDDYWYDRSYYYSPLYKTSLYPRSYYYTDYLSNPYYWSWPYSYWSRYRGSWYDYTYPSYYRRYNLDGYPSYRYWPYSSYLADTLNTSLYRGMSLYRSGMIPYSALDRYWLTPSYWDRRFKAWREPHIWDKHLNLPTHFDRRARQYVAHWT